MQLSTRGRYAVMAMVDLATRQTLGCECGPVCLAEIAARQKLSQAYLEQLFGKLRRAGLVGSARGPGGGYRLARSSDAIAIADIIAAVDEPIHATRCENGSPGCIEGSPTEGRSAARHTICGTNLAARSSMFLQGVTLADVVAGRVLGRAVPLGRRPEAGGRVAMVYLDANATEPLRPEARAAMLAALDVDRKSVVRACVPAVRRAGSWRMRARRWPPGSARGRANLVFTSGGTEADALAIHALGAGRRVIVGATEHDAVRAAAPSGAVAAGRSRRRRRSRRRWQAWLADGPPALVCLMLANNETGTIQPIAEAAALCRRHGAWLHVDAVQAAGRMDVRLPALGAHSIAISSHKLGGPPGAGALLLAPEVAVDRRR